MVIADIIFNGWVNPEVPATPLTGYRKRAVSASVSGSIHGFTPKLPRPRELFFFGFL
jgi:hypothetical protein